MTTDDVRILSMKGTLSMKGLLMTYPQHEGYTMTTDDVRILSMKGTLMMTTDDVRILSMKGTL